MATRRRRRRLLAGGSLLAFLLAVVAHRGVLDTWFVGHDTLPFLLTSRVETPADLLGLFTAPMLAGTEFVRFGLFYRPVSNLTYAVDYWLWGLDPFGYHLTNLLLHGAAAALAVPAVAAVTHSDRVGALAGALFAVHPLAVDVVPTTARRHDLLLAVFGLLALWLFVSSHRRGNRRGWYAAALVYAIALLSKETALVLAPLVGLWALLGHPALRGDPDDGASWRVPSATDLARATVDALRATAPLAVATVAYLGLRVAVIGDLGGYLVTYPAIQRPLAPVRYLVSLAYPADVLSAVADAIPAGTVVVVAGLAVLAAGYAAAFVRATRTGSPAASTPGESSGLDETSGSEAKHGGPRTVDRAAALGRGALAVGAAVALVAVGGVLARASAPAPVAVPGVAHPVWYAVGIGVVAAAGGALALARSVLGSAGTGRSELFLLVWLALPVPLFVLSGKYTFRSGYFFVVPFVALLARYLVGRWDAASGSRGSSGGPRGSADRPRGPRRDRVRVALALAALVLVIPSLAASPLLHDDTGWEAVGESNRVTLEAVEREAAAVDGDPVVVRGLAFTVDHEPKRLGQARERKVLRPYTVETWLRLRGVESPVTGGEPRHLDDLPPRTWTTTSTENGTRVISVHYGR